jgi:hypothetical protein
MRTQRISVCCPCCPRVLVCIWLSLHVNLQYKHVCVCVCVRFSSHVRSGLSVLLQPCPIWFVYPPATSDLVCLPSGYVRSGLFSPASTPSPYSPRVGAIYSRFGLYLKSAINTPVSCPAIAIKDVATGTGHTRGPGGEARTARQKRHLPQIDLGAQDLNDIQRPKSFRKNSWK